MSACSTQSAPRVRPSEIKNEIDERGAFIRQQNHFTTPFGDKETDLKAEKGRYKLFWAKGCHWSNRASIVRELLGLEDVISVDIVGKDKDKLEYGWAFVHQNDKIDADTGASFLSQLYANADPEYRGRATVPALVDLKTKKVVNNDYHRLTNYLEVAFKPFHKENAPDLYPEHLRDKIDSYNDNFLFPKVNNGTYRMMFAQSLTAYQEGYDDFFGALEEIDKQLENQRFLFGDTITDSDIRLFVTLARFETRYYRYLGPIKRRLTEYKNIWAYARDLYEVPAFKNNTYFRDIAAVDGKREALFETFAVRFADEVDYEALWSQPQQRKQLSKTPDEKFLISQE